jgi:hypothetical protein
MLLGASAHAALIGCLIFGSTPSFIFQNFFQTRNDYALATFYTWGWILLLENIRKPHYRKPLYSGMLFGFGTLMKLSAPGYVLWGLVAYGVRPLALRDYKTIQRRTLDIGILGLGFLLACGWHFIPALPEILNYHLVWSHQMSQWQKVQYSLSSGSSFRLFYLKNFINVHLLGFFGAFVAVSAIGITLLAASKKSRNTLASWVRKEETVLSILTVFTSITFLTLNRSISSLGDIPVLPIVVALGIASFSSLLPPSVPQGLAGKFRPARVFAFCIPLLLYSFYRLPIISFQTGTDFETYTAQLEAIIKQYNLNPKLGMNLFSHPVYNQDTFFWNYVKGNHNLLGVGIPLSHMDVVEAGENVEKIAKVMSNYQFIVVAKQPLLQLNGEPFSPLNRFQSEVSSAVFKQGDFIPVSSFPIENGKFTFQVFVNKQVSVFSIAEPKAIFTDGWIPWNAAFKLMSFQPVRLRLKGTSLKRINEVVLSDSDGTIILKAIGTDKNETVFESEIIKPNQGRTRTLILSPRTPEDKVKIENDPRPLALRNVRADTVAAD